MNFAYVWERGRVKEKNEDSLFFREVITAKGKLAVACICDGMGGMKNGEKASGYVVEQIEKWMMTDLLAVLKRDYRSRIIIKGAGKKILFSLNQDLFQHMRKSGETLGTTCSLLILYRKHYYVFHIGDSRIYLLHQTILTKRLFMRKITQDHKVGTYTLIRCLGLNQNGKVDFVTGKMKDDFLICSDGFCNRYQKGELEKFFFSLSMQNEDKVYRRLRELADKSIAKGERDNITAIYVGRKRKWKTE